MDVKCFWCEETFPITKVEQYMWKFPENIKESDEPHFRKYGWPDRKEIVTYCCNGCHNKYFNKDIEDKPKITNDMYVRRRFNKND